MTRQEANNEILQRLALEIVRYPDLRFSQILVNLNIVEKATYSNINVNLWEDEFYTEPQAILKRMSKSE